MSNINISRAVENIRASTTVYTPLVEVVVNSIQAIESSRVSGGKVAIRVRRDAQLEADGLSDHPKPATDYHLKTGQRE